MTRSYRMTDYPPLNGWSGVLGGAPEEPLAYAPRPPAVDQWERE